MARVPIAAATLKGYQAEGARTNLCLQSQTLGTTWVPANATVTADQYVAPDGTTTVDKLTASAGSAAHYIGLSLGISWTAVPHTLSAYMRYDNNRWNRLVAYDTTNTFIAVFDLLNGVVGNVSAGVTSTIEATGTANVYRCSMTFTPLAAAATIYPGLNSSNIATEQVFNAAGTEAVGIWGVQVEAASFASSYIPTTTVAVARNADVLSYANSGNINLTIGTAYAEYTRTGTGGDRGIIAGGAGNQRAVMTDSATQNWGYDGANLPSVTGDSAASTPVRVATTWGSSAMQCFRNGTAGTATSFDGSLEDGSTISIGQSAGAGNLFGTVRNVRIYGSKLSAGQIASIPS